MIYPGEHTHTCHLDLTLAPSSSTFPNGSATERNTADLNSGWWSGQASSKKIPPERDKLVIKETPGSSEAWGGEPAEVRSSKPAFQSADPKPTLHCKHSLVRQVRGPAVVCYIISPASLPLGKH